jgi:hypothetical protein
VGTVTAGYEGCAQALFAAIEVPEGAPNAGLVRDERRNLNASIHALSNRRQVVTEHRLSLRLGNEKDERKFGIDRANVVERNEESLRRAQMDGQAGACISAPPKGLDNSEIAQDLEASRMDDERSGFVGAVNETVDDADTNAERVKRRRQHQPRWPGAHHQDVHGCSFVHLITATSLARATILRASTAE